MGFAFFHTLYKLAQEKYRIRRQRYLVILECIVYPAMGAVVSFFISYVPYIILGILPSIIKVLIEMQNANIYTEALTRELRSYLKELSEERRFAFPLTVSVGYASCTDPKEQIIDVKKRADEVLYQDKKVQNAGIIE